MGMPLCTTMAHALTVQAALNAKIPGFMIRERVQGKEPLPVGSPVSTPITVHETRQLMAQHGQDVLVVVAWSKDGLVNIATAGNSESNADVAAGLGQRIVQGLGLLQDAVLEDRRKEHGA